ncbi:MAG: energy transducer TonB [Planctomycetota bacterium]|nr:energy transducer TonB [Planctomycetota bacterium]
MLNRCWNLLKTLVNRTVVVAGALALTLIFFIVLPLTQTITDRGDETLVARQVRSDPYEPPPEEIEEEEEEEEQEEEPPPPEFEPPDQLLELDQLEMLLGGGGFGGYGDGTMVVDLGDLAGEAKDATELFNAADLDKKPQAISQPEPDASAPELQRRMPGRVRVIFIVDEQGRVQNPKVTESTDPIFERPALNAVRRWTFEPGERKGQPVPFRMRVWIGFGRK